MEPVSVLWVLVRHLEEEAGFLVKLGAGYCMKFGEFNLECFLYMLLVGQVIRTFFRV